MPQTPVEDPKSRELQVSRQQQNCRWIYFLEASQGSGLHRGPKVPAKQGAQRARHELT